jgi:DNA polymerase III epsilon subunit family exonuclease
MSSQDAHIRCECPDCGKVLRVPAKYAGQVGKCSKCGGAVTVPKPPPATITAPAFESPPAAPAKPQGTGSNIPSPVFEKEGRPAVPSRGAPRPGQSMAKKAPTAKKPKQLPELFVAFDVETTGLTAGPDRIIEIGAIKFSLDGQTQGSFQKLANPGFHIPEAASNVNNISDSMVARAPAPGVVVREFIEWVGPEAVLVSHNASFDIDFLVVTLAMGSIDIPEGWLALDTLSWARACPALSLQDYKLETLCQAIGYSTQHAHRGLADAGAVLQLARLLVGQEEDAEKEMLKRAKLIVRMAQKRATASQIRYLERLSVPSWRLAQPTRIDVGLLIQEFDSPAIRQAMVEEERARYGGYRLGPDGGIEVEIPITLQQRQRAMQIPRAAKQGCGCLVLLVGAVSILAALLLSGSTGSAQNDGGQDVAVYQEAQPDLPQAAVALPAIPRRPRPPRDLQAEIDELIQRTIFVKVEVPRRYPHLWVGPRFYTLDEASQEQHVGLVHEFHMQENPNRDKVVLYDHETGEQIGQYSIADGGLKLRRN